MGVSNMAPNCWSHGWCGGFQYGAQLLVTWGFPIWRPTVGHMDGVGVSNMAATCLSRGSREESTQYGVHLLVTWTEGGRIQYGAHLLVTWIEGGSIQQGVHLLVTWTEGGSIQYGVHLLVTWRGGVPGNRYPIWRLTVGYMDGVAVSKMGPHVDHEEAGRKVPNMAPTCWSRRLWEGIQYGAYLSLKYMEVGKFSIWRPPVVPC
jgi:hypothetical protein